MKRFKFGISFLLVVLLCALTQQFLLLINYMLALTFHELAHLFVAAKHGYTIKEFKINMFGVSLELNEQIDDKDAFSINIAGPLFNFVLSVVCVALYWIIPKSFCVLNTFCVSNLIIAIFNLLPVYPLDGGKIFASIMTSKKYKKFDEITKIVLCFVSILFFVSSCFSVVNLYWLLLAVFFLTSKAYSQNKLTLFKTKNNNIQKIRLLKITGNETLFQLLKQIDSKYYTIFYINNIKTKYIDEDEVVSLSTHHPLIAQIEELI